MRVSNPDCSPFGIDSRDAAPTPAAFLEIVSDYFASNISLARSGSVWDYDEGS
jgi:hypothetical protein